MYDACMTQIIQVRDVPDDVHKILTKEAKKQGLSLNRFLLQELERMAGRYKNMEVLSRLSKLPRPRTGPTDTVDLIRQMREEE
jgi:hypothetical protein